MKTPDKIKMGLELHMGTKSCNGLCPYDGYSIENGTCVQRLLKDAIAYIQQLEKRLADVNASPFDGGMSQAEYFNGGANNGHR